MIFLRMDTGATQYVAHLFAENIPTGRGLDTDYAALRQATAAMMFLAAQQELSQVAIPGYLGCGLAGGDWETVWQRIIMPLFFRVLLYPYHPVPAGQHPASLDNGIWRHPYEPGNRMY